MIDGTTLEKLQLVKEMKLFLIFYKKVLEYWKFIWL